MKYFVNVIGVIYACSLVWRLGGNMVNDACSANWISTPATVLQSSTNFDWFKKGNSWQPCVEYTYSINGKLYSGNQYSFPNPHCRETKEIEAILKDYPPGKVIRVFYDSRNPNSSCIKKGTPYGWISSVSVLLFFGFGVGMCLLLLKKPGLVKNKGQSTTRAW